MNSLTCHRFLHINTGTHGTEDGSNINWSTKKNEQELADDEVWRKEWIDGANTFLN